ncbi:MAG TPA: PTS sugar transporter subunit IIA [Candidatus Polarisedimenticolaceae bacterium]|nr:PTS sugar transporter subunit IIA [Candidatus Polarisedimenticolaceae bacterium]
MIGLLVITHGRIAEELVAAAREIVGALEGIEPLCVGWDEDVGAVARRVEQAIARVDRGRGVLILTDMFGGTPTNLALSHLERGRVEIVTGVNLPMLIKYTSLREEPELIQVAATIAEQGRQSIQVASQLLDAHEPGSDRAE